MITIDSYIEDYNPFIGHYRILQQLGAIYNFNVNIKIDSENYGPSKYYFNIYDTTPEVEEIITKILQSSCGRCGHVIESVSRFTRSIDDIRCDKCLGHETIGLKRLYHYIDHLKKDSIDEIGNWKVRLINDKGNFFYTKLKNLTYKDNEIYVSNEINTIEKVRFAGIDTGFRDVNGIRIYAGDYVRFICNDIYRGRPTIGVFFDFSSLYGIFLYKNQSIDDMSIMSKGIIAETERRNRMFGVALGRDFVPYSSLKEVEILGSIYDKNLECNKAYKDIEYFIECFKEYIDLSIK